MHSVDSVIHVFTHSQGPVSGYTSITVHVCVTCSVAVLFCGLVLFPRGLSSFTEPWQRMEAGRGVRCIKKPLPSSDLSPLPRAHTHSHTQTCLPHHLTIPRCGSTLHSIKSRDIEMHVHSHARRHTHSYTIKHTHSIIRWLPWRKSEGTRRRSAQQWWFCILMEPLLSYSPLSW